MLSKNFIVVFLLLISLVFAFDYYISPFGDDTGTGSDSAPFRTLQRASKACSSGDTIMVMPGSYDSNVAIFSAIAIKATNGLGSVFFSYPCLSFGDSANITGINFIGGTCYSAIYGYCSSSHVTSYVITNCSFRSNTRAIEYARCSIHVTIINCLFTNNGQDISNDWIDSTLNIDNSTFEQSGGIASGGQLTISDSVFSRISSSGGAISLTGGVTTISDSVFSSISSSNVISSGGAISLNNATLAMKNSKFINCSTQFNGGAILISGHSRANILSSSFCYNFATKSGGAVYIEKSSTLSVFNTDFKNNVAPTGGAYACDPTAIVQQVGCTFKNSTVGSCLTFE